LYNIKYLIRPVTSHSIKIKVTVQKVAMNIRSIIVSLLLLTWVGMPSPSQALETIHLDRNTRSLQIGEKIEILEDTTGTLTFKDIISRKWDRNFKKSLTPVPNYAFTDKVYWIRFSLKTESRNSTEWLLELAYPLMDDIEFYSPDEKGNYKTIKTGYRHPFHEREYKHRHFVFRCSLEPGEGKTFYIRFQNEDRMEIPLTLWPEKAFIQKDHDEQYAMGVYLGIIMIMFFFNLLLYISIKDRTYLYYVLFLAAFGLFQIIQNGLVYEYFWPEILYRHNHIIPQSIALTLMATILLTRSYLNTKDYFPRLHKLFNRFLAVYVLTIIGDVFIKYPVSIQIQVALVIVVLSLCLYTGITALLKGYRPAKFFMLAWTAIFIGGIIYALKVMAIVPSNFFTSYALQIGSVLLILLLSFGLGDRINLIEKEKNEAQETAINAQKEIINGMKEMNRQKDLFLEETSKKNREIESLNIVLQEKIDDLNITNRELKLSEERYRFLIEGTNDIIFTLDNDFAFTSANKAIKTELKIDPSTVNTMNFLDLVYEDYEADSITKQVITQKLESFSDSKKPVQFKAQLNSKILSEPKEYQIRLEYISAEGKGIILGKASSVNDDSLVKYLECERQRFTIQNYLVIADEISQRITRNLRKYFEQKKVNLIRIALREMIINAIEHGNLNISYDEKSQAMEEDNYFEIVSQRQHDPLYKDRKVYIEYRIGPEKIAYKITDEGDGFDHSQILQKTQEANEFMLSHGRGISISQEIFDEITYNKKGNQVLLIKYITEEENSPISDSASA